VKKIKEPIEIDIKITINDIFLFNRLFTYTSFSTSKLRLPLNYLT